MSLRKKITKEYSEEGILKIEQCTTSEQALESDSAKAKSDFETVKARQKQKMLKVIASVKTIVMPRIDIKKLTFLNIQLN